MAHTEASFQAFKAATLRAFFAKHGLAEVFETCGETEAFEALKQAKPEEFETEHPHGPGTGRHTGRKRLPRAEWQASYGEHVQPANRRMRHKRIPVGHESSIGDSAESE